MFFDKSVTLNETILAAAVLAAGMFLFCSPKAGAQALSLGSAATYNVYTLSNDYDSSDSGGAVAVGGNAVFSGYSVGDDLAPGSSAPNLVVGGTLTATYGTVNGSVYANTMDWSDPTINGNIDANVANLNAYGTVTGTVTYGKTYSDYATGNPLPNTTNPTNPTNVKGKVSQGAYTSPINFTKTNSTLISDSSQLGTLMTTTGDTITEANDAVTMTGTNKTLNIFDLTTSQLAAGTFTVNCPAGSTVLINVAGSADTWQGNLTLTGGVTANDVIYNFANATSLDLSGIDIQGSLLAPNASVSGSGDIYGNLIVGTLISGDTEEANYDDTDSNQNSGVTLDGDLFAGVLPNGGQLSMVPEPNSAFIVLFGLLLLAVLGISKRSRSFVQMI